MPKKRTSDEPALGSDSFLDVLCNMVGILVILIVIAGLRAAKAPVKLPAAALPVTAITNIDEEEEPVPVELGTPVTFPMVFAEEPPPPGTPNVKLVPPAPPAELVEEAERLRRELVEIRKTQAAVRKEAEQVEAPKPPLALEELELALQQDLLALQNESLTRQARQLEVNELKQALERARAELASMENSRPAPKVLQHRLAPLARVVSSKEIHFRLSGGRISVVPIDALVESLQSQIQRQREFIMSRDRYASSVGPIEGYRMEYAIQRHKAGNIADELKYGQTMVRMVVSGWVIRAEGEPPSETAEEALRPGSRFLQALREGGSLATLTFWIYPDSFDTYRKLQDFAHERDLNVAARPLPEGVPIAGSPQGSRSMAQ